ncbi:Urease operon accessory protein [Shinella pollutisoli]|uniref:Urease operon accessory protein n=1 Tax=Shinella pollutisoli TaxID=2250594 RepID=A0ABV7DMC3_9HYPH
MARRIVIVGNGDIPEGVAEAIDGADLVIRFNACRSAGRGGLRTDVVAVCNTGRPALAMLGGGWQSLETVRQARAIWCVRAPEKFAALRGPLSERHPDLDDFCDDHTLGFTTFAQLTGRALRIVPPAVHDRLDAALSAHAPPAYVVPSSGLVVIADVLDNLAADGDDVTLAGFGHQGWPGHPFAAERLWVEARIAEGRLRRLHPDNRPSASGGR